MIFVKNSNLRGDFQIYLSFYSIFLFLFLVCFHIFRIYFISSFYILFLSYSFVNLFHVAYINRSFSLSGYCHLTKLLNVSSSIFLSQRAIKVSPSWCLSGRLEWFNHEIDQRRVGSRILLQADGSSGGNKVLGIEWWAEEMRGWQEMVKGSSYK